MSQSSLRKGRMRLFREIEKKTDSYLLVYFTGDRQGLETKIAHDALPFCIKRLLQIKRSKTISLFLYTTGGLTMAGYGLVNLIREFCDRFICIVPFKALSCGTLIALGADEIMMSRMGQLSPIDPSTPHILGPRPEGAPPNIQPIPISVEDVVNYLDMARKELEIKDQDLLERIYDRLSQEIHPLALGSVFRIRTQIEFLAKSLLSTHIKDETRIDSIINTLYRGRYSHDYPIGRKEAKSVIGLPVDEISDDFEKLIIRLYEHYDRLLELSVPFNPELALGRNETATNSYNRAIIESYNLTHVFRSTHEFRRITLQPPQVPIPTEIPQVRLIEQRWVEDNNI